MKTQTRRYRGIWTIETTKAGYVVRRRGEYRDTVATYADALQLIDRLQCGY